MSKQGDFWTLVEENEKTLNRVFFSAPEWLQREIAERCCIPEQYFEPTRAREMSQTFQTWAEFGAKEQADPSADIAAKRTEDRCP